VQFAAVRDDCAANQACKLKLSVDIPETSAMVRRLHRIIYKPTAPLHYRTTELSTSDFITHCLTTRRPHFSTSNVHNFVQKLLTSFLNKVLYKYMLHIPSYHQVERGTSTGENSENKNLRSTERRRQSTGVRQHA